MTTQANHKRNMREGEEILLNAEKFSSLAWLQGHDYPQAKLNDGWKKVLFNQFHDLAAGSGIGVIYRDGDRETNVVRLETAQAQEGAMQALAAHINTSRRRSSRRGLQSSWMAALRRRRVHRSDARANSRPSRSRMLPARLSSQM